MSPPADDTDGRWDFKVSSFDGQIHVENYVPDVSLVYAVQDALALAEILETMPDNEAADLALIKAIRDECARVQGSKP